MHILFNTGCLWLILYLQPGYSMGGNATGLLGLQLLQGAITGWITLVLQGGAKVHFRWECDICPDVITLAP